MTQPVIAAYLYRQEKYKFSMRELMGKRIYQPTDELY